MTAPADTIVRDDQTDEYRRRIVELVDQAPPLGQGQKAQLAMLLRDAVREHTRPEQGRRAA